MEKIIQNLVNQFSYVVDTVSSSDTVSVIRANIQTEADSAEFMRSLTEVTKSQWIYDRKTIGNGR